MFERELYQDDISGLFYFKPINQFLLQLALHLSNYRAIGIASINVVGL